MSSLLHGRRCRVRSVVVDSKSRCMANACALLLECTGPCVGLGSFLCTTSTMLVDMLLKWHMPGTLAD
jgi:hypothetical protein